LRGLLFAPGERHFVDGVLEHRGLALEQPLQIPPRLQLLHLLHQRRQLRFEHTRFDHGPHLQLQHGQLSGVGCFRHHQL
jgi:hypothetical protein